MKEEKYRLTTNAEDGRAALMVLARALEVDDSGPFEIQCRKVVARILRQALGNSLRILD